MRVCSLLVTVACALTGCEAWAAPSDLVDQLIAIRDRMHARFAATANIRTAIALGDLERVHAEARVIVQLDEPDMLPEWQPYVANIRDAASQIAGSTSTVAAARTFATLGRRCAQCHEAAGAKIVFAKVASPVRDIKLPSQMAEHQWATARLWEGLIGPSQPLWLAGANALTGARLAVTAETGELGVADDVARVRLIARRAQRARTNDDRAQLFGELLGTCAHCHFTIRDR
jgi:hypothetical protein